MGALVAEHMVPSVQTEVNLRFGPGDAINEMRALHQEFALFSGEHGLENLAKLLNIAPRDERERQGWIDFLNFLKMAPSDVPGMNAHDRIIVAIRENLEEALEPGQEPTPIFSTWHSDDESPGLLVTTKPAFSFSETSYLTISVPTKAAGGGNKAN